MVPAAVGVLPANPSLEQRACCSGSIGKSTISMLACLIDTPDGCDFREAAGLSAYSDLVRMTGRDLNGEIRMLRREVIEAKEAA